jgi:hypothetical protein
VASCIQDHSLTPTRNLLERLAVVTRLTLEWRKLDREHAALVFDVPTWAIFAAEAKARGIEPSEMIVRAIAELLGPAERINRFPLDDPGSE